MTQDSNADLTIHVVEEVLSDGSSVWNVEFNGESYAATDENNARACADTIATAISKHCLETAKVINA